MLIASVPELREGWLEEAGVGGPLPSVASPADNADLCRFLSRCPMRIDGVCNRITPPRVRLTSGNEILCHKDEEELMHLHFAKAAGL